jgi:hypothetical protein
MNNTIVHGGFSGKTSYLEASHGQPKCCRVGRKERTTRRGNDSFSLFSKQEEETMIFPFSQEKGKEARSEPTIGRLSDRN